MPPLSPTSRLAQRTPLSSHPTHSVSRDPSLPLRARMVTEFTSTSSSPTFQRRADHSVRTTQNCNFSWTQTNCRKAYHIHVLPVAEGGNCSSTLAHLDPFVRGEKPPCDPSAPETCQTGDLSGKYGKVEGSDPFTDSYDDPFTSLVSIHHSSTPTNTSSNSF